YVSRVTSENIELAVQIRNQGNPISTLPISLFETNNLVAKNAVEIDTETSAVFTIPANKKFNGSLSIEDPNLQYDNELFFNIDESSKIKVLSINQAKDDYLKKIYTADEFEFIGYDFNALNYNLIDSQNLIILNELERIPVSLTTALLSFSSNGGSILIIPSNKSNVNTYNQFFANYNYGRFQELNPLQKKITSINFSHPLLTNVFSNQINNFQYPRVNSYFPSSNNSGVVLRYEDNTPFLSQIENVFITTAPLNQENSNFQNSPLIVPVFYNIGKQSLKIPQLYFNIGDENTIDISTKLQQDDILTLSNETNSVVPLQQTYPNKVSLKTNDYPNLSGILDVKNKENILIQLSFNFKRDESLLRYMDLESFENIETYNTISDSLEAIKSATNVNELWKWFVIFALGFLLIEMSILKFLK
ncbi:MAG: hypothetical protein HRU26_11675, partial [Psychroserpens sp.]|nr:hypothetical protein [Psychroserpens sp.]